MTKHFSISGRLNDDNHFREFIKPCKNNTLKFCVLQ